MTEKGVKREHPSQIVAVVLLVALSGCAATGDGPDGKKRIAGNAAAVDGAKMGTADGPSSGHTLTGSGPTAGMTLDVPNGAVPAGTVVGMGIPARARQQAARASLPSNLKLVAPGTLLEV